MTTPWVQELELDLEPAAPETAPASSAAPTVESPPTTAPTSEGVPEHALPAWAAQQDAALTEQVARDALEDARGEARVAAARRADLETRDETTEAERVLADEELASTKRKVRRLEQAAAASTAAHGAAVRNLSGALAQPAPHREAEPELAFANFEEWFREFVVPVYRRRVGARGEDLRWSREWWKNPEAVFRVRAMWLAFESARLEPGPAMGAWMRDVFDRHMDVMMQPSGPFWHEPRDLLVSNEDGSEWDVTPAPEGTFPDYRVIDGP